MGAGRHTGNISVSMTESAGVLYTHVSGSVAQTALIVAAQNGHADVVKVLLDAGANVEGHSELYIGQVTKNGQTGVFKHFACFFPLMKPRCKQRHKQIIKI